MIYYTTTYLEHDLFNIGDKRIYLRDTKDLHRLKDHGIVFLWGGSDIGTDLYNETPNNYCSNSEPSYRDIFELKVINKAIENNIPIVGICRGAQLLCVHQKGKLLQHINNHCQPHLIITKDGQTLKTNSWHHQMMIPTEDAIIYAKCKEKTTGFNQNNQVLLVKAVPEIVYWPKINSLGIQGHPEFADCPREFFKYLNKLIHSLYKE